MISMDFTSHYSGLHDSAGPLEIVFIQQEYEIYMLKKKKRYSTEVINR